MDVIKGITQTLQSYTEGETNFRVKMQTELGNLKNTLADVKKIADKLKGVNDKIGVIKTQLETANEETKNAKKLNQDITSAVGELGEVVKSLNSIDPASNTLTQMLAESMQAITNIQSEVAQIEAGRSEGDIDQRQQQRMQQQQGLVGGRRRKRRGGYSYRKKSKSPRKTRKAKKSKSRSKTRSKTRSRTRSKTR